MKSWFLRLWRENKSLIVFVVLMLVFRSAIADWNDVPTGSMKPTIIEGDRILVNKLAYDLRVPFTHISLYRIANPERGDIVVFDSEVSEKRLVKRVVGLPGDQIALINNQLYINGVKLSYQLQSSDAETATYIEDLLGLQHQIRVNNQPTVLANMPSVEVPEGFYFALGDNRDNSADSRVIGFVPRNEIVGRSRSLVLSVDYDNYFIPRADRYLQSL